eukprot:4502-Heterococcus_DN1.PRE.1
MLSPRALAEEQAKIKARKALGEFMRRAESDLESARRLMESMEKKFAKVLEYFGEDPELAPNKFFTTLHSFIAAFDEARVYVERQQKVKDRERKLAEKRRLAAEAEQKAAEKAAAAKRIAAAKEQKALDAAAATTADVGAT